LHTGSQGIGVGGIFIGGLEGLSSLTPGLRGPLRLLDVDCKSKLFGFDSWSSKLLWL
jgi:hypothetical protein